jgi:hypothetical protein
VIGSGKGGRRTGLAKATALVSSSGTGLGLLDTARVYVLLYGTQTVTAVGCGYRLQSLPLSPTQLHNLIFQPLLTLIMCSLDCPTCWLVTARHPARDACFWLVAPYICVDSCEKGIVGMFEGGCGEYLGKRMGELFLVEVAEEEE